MCCLHVSCKAYVLMLLLDFCSLQPFGQSALGLRKTIKDGSPALFWRCRMSTVCWMAPFLNSDMTSYLPSNLGLALLAFDVYQGRNESCCMLRSCYEANNCTTYFEEGRPTDPVRIPPFLDRQPRLKGKRKTIPTELQSISVRGRGSSLSPKFDKTSTYFVYQVCIP